MTIATAPITGTDIQPLLLDVSTTTLTVTPEQFASLCLKNPDLRLELTPDSKLIVMAPTGGESGRKNFKLSGQLFVWNERTELGEAFDSSTGYDLTVFGGGKPSPDVSWIEKSRLESVNIIGLIPLVPDFVVELRSETDSLSEAQKKMRDYQQVKVRMGLLIDPKKKRVEIYRPGQEVEILEDPTSIDCNEVMPGFILDISRIW
ncbi:Uma2 family endonuclease [Chamaesiphon sp. GL140_3_metabinner_50]|uniref:Uma2 family endonuclease n=1 Tax=Chamaesiphon sp. GL140_3_metabinner_50 TaxID=2970812 RepID=UPI0025EA3460|nr:Uma2 family endonuclease [Chamaesiphon sp. GL140_3_metabinner_50]